MSCCTLVGLLRTQYLFLLHSAMTLLLSNVNIQANSHSAMVIFQVLLFLRSTFCFQFLCSGCSLRNNSALLNLHFVCTIIMLIIKQ